MSGCGAHRSVYDVAETAVQFLVAVTGVISKLQLRSRGDCIQSIGAELRSSSDSDSNDDSTESLRQVGFGDCVRLIVHRIEAIRYEDDDVLHPGTIPALRRKLVVANLRQTGGHVAGRAERAAGETDTRDHCLQTGPCCVGV